MKFSLLLCCNNWVLSIVVTGKSFLRVKWLVVFYFSMQLHIPCVTYIEHPVPHAVNVCMYYVFIHVHVHTLLYTFSFYNASSSSFYIQRFFFLPGPLAAILGMFLSCYWNIMFMCVDVCLVCVCVWVCVCVCVWLKVQQTCSQAWWFYICLCIYFRLVSV